MQNQQKPPDLSLDLAIEIRKNIVKALNDFSMIEDQDRILVCVSGGKDSSILLASLKEIQRRSEKKFQIEAAILDQKQPGFQIQEFQNWVQDILQIKLHVIERDTYSIVTDKIKDGTYCSLCSRIRRAILYDFAFDNKFTKIALGHHRDDLLQTLLLNLFYSGKIASMPAKLLSDDGRNILIRPMAYVAEKDLIELAKLWSFPIIPCNLCGSQDGLKRQKMKALIRSLESEVPALSASMLTALGNVRPSQLLDSSLWDFNFKTSNKETNLSSVEIF